MTLIENAPGSRRALRSGDLQRCSDRELVEAAATGDQAAFDLLFARHRTTVERAASRVLGDPAEAQDAVQLTFVKTWRAADRLDPARPFGPWVRTVARRVAIDLVRSRTRRERVDRHDVEHEESAEISCALITERERVRRAVDQLPELEQQVVLLTYFGGLTHLEAAEWLGIPVGTVKSRSHRAHRHLFHLLGGA